MHFAELVAVYALDACESSERRRVERHLRRCPPCRRELDRHRSALAALTPHDRPTADGGWQQLRRSLEAAPADSVGRR